MSSKSVDDFLAGLGQKKAAAEDNKPKRQWRSLLGQILEFGDSGFQIILNKSGNAQRPFQLRDPEGRVMGEGDNLDVMKRVAEDQARMRDEFSAVDPDSFNTLPKFDTGTSH